MTPHITAKKEDIAKIVLMPGDPLRAEFIAMKYLTNVVKVNEVRNMFMYTGMYNKTRVTVAGSGMGMPSIGIYSFELFHFYDVEAIIRVGSSGSYVEDLDVHDLVLANSSFSMSTFAQDAVPDFANVMYPSESLNRQIEKAAYELNMPLRVGRIESEDVFYNKLNAVQRRERSQALCVEMESFALFAIAKRLNKKAACLLTISDNLVTTKAVNSEVRQTGFSKMIEIALRTAEIYEMESK